VSQTSFVTACLTCCLQWRATSAPPCINHITPTLYWSPKWTTPVRELALLGYYAPSSGKSVQKFRVPKRRCGITVTVCVIDQRSAVFICSATEPCRHLYSGSFCWWWIWCNIFCRSFACLARVNVQTYTQ